MALGLWLGITAGAGPKVLALDAGSLKAANYELTIKPEYDNTQVLVINEAWLTNTSATPYQGWIGFRVPKGAQLQMVCEVRPDGGHACQPYRTEDKGDYLEIIWKNTRPISQVDRFPIYVEYYYDPFSQRSPRKFTHVLNSIYPIDQLSVVVTEPKGATGFTLTPAGAASLPQDKDGLAVWRYILNSVPAGPTPFSAEYQRSTDAPSVAPPPDTDKGGPGASSPGASGSSPQGRGAPQGGPRASGQANQSGLFLLAVVLAGVVVLVIHRSSAGRGNRPE